MQRDFPLIPHHHHPPAWGGAGGGVKLLTWDSRPCAQEGAGSLAWDQQASGVHDVGAGFVVYVKWGLGFPYAQFKTSSPPGIPHESPVLDQA